ncbi:MAG: rhodanese-like domain-containing protein, partial [Opitutaceae bacterium]
GLQAWQASGAAIESGTGPKFAQKNYTPAPARTSLVTTNTVAEQLGRPVQTILDARAAPRFRGEVEPIDPVAGHIPKAANRFFKANLKADLTFRPASELRREFMELIGGRTVENVGHSCGSGITACANIFAMEYAGIPGSKLYAGSWSEWVSDPTRPVAKGT